MSVAVRGFSAMNPVRGKTAEGARASKSHTRLRKCRGLLQKAND